jgi:hypothetical protein
MRAIGISLLLAAIPFAFIVYMVFTGDIGVPPHWTVDGLFMTLILLTISGILALNALLEAKAIGLIRLPGMQPALAGAGGGAFAAGAASAMSGNLKTDIGVIQDVEYFDAPIGQSNKSIVRLRGKGDKQPRTLVLYGNMRGLLIPGRKMQLTYFPEGAGATLVSFDFK